MSGESMQCEKVSWNINSQTTYVVKDTTYKIY